MDFVPSFALVAPELLLIGAGLVLLLVAAWGGDKAARGIAIAAAAALFGAGFMLRPLGALVFGRIGDRLVVSPLFHRVHHAVGIGHMALGMQGLGHVILARQAQAERTERRVKAVIKDHRRHGIAVTHVQVPVVRAKEGQGLGAVRGHGRPLGCREKTGKRSDFLISVPNPANVAPSPSSPFGVRPDPPRLRHNVCHSPPSHTALYRPEDFAWQT